MSTLGLLLGLQIALGALDNFWHHEIREALPGKREARVELALHAGRELCYALLFAALAWWEWRGVWALALVGLLGRRDRRDAPRFRRRRRHSAPAESRTRSAHGTRHQLRRLAGRIRADVARMGAPAARCGAASTTGSGRGC